MYTIIRLSDGKRICGPWVFLDAQGALRYLLKLHPRMTLARASIIYRVVKL